MSKALDPNDIDLAKSDPTPGEVGYTESASKPSSAYDKLQAMKGDLIQKSASVSGPAPKRYPSSMLSLADMEIPDRVADMFKWCRYFYTFDSLIAGAINALAQFPVTQISLEESEDYLLVERDESDKKSGKMAESKEMKSVKYNLFQRINIYKLLIEIGIDYFLYGNCFVYGEIDNSEGEGEANWKFIRRIPPNKIYIDVDFEGNPTYKWNVPDRIKHIVKSKKPKKIYDTIPEIIRDSVLKNKAIVLKAANIFHFARPSDSMGETVWGTPIVANVMKLLMYRNVLRQAQEAVAREHIVPLRIFYLNPIAGTSQANINAAEAFAGELVKWTREAKYKIVSSAPVGIATAGGNGRSLLLGPEIEASQAEILAGMNVPREFIFGGLSYSGSSISMRILENHFITYRLLQESFINNFIIKGLLKARKVWRNEEDNKFLVKAKLGELKMQDDAQQKQLFINLNQAGKLSDEQLYATLGIDAHKMKSSLKKEAEDAVEMKKAMDIAGIKNQSVAQKISIIENYKLQNFEARLRVAFENGDIDKLLEMDLDEIEDALKDIEVSPDIERATPTATQGATGVLQPPEIPIQQLPPMGAPGQDPNQPADPNAQVAPEANGQEQAQGEQEQAQGGQEYNQSEGEIQNTALQVLKTGNANHMVLMLQNIGRRGGPEIASRVASAVANIAPSMLDPDQLQDLKLEMEHGGFHNEAGYLQIEDDSNDPSRQTDMTQLPSQLPPRRYSV